MENLGALTPQEFQNIFSSQVLSIKGNKMLLQVIVNAIYFELRFKEEKLTSRKSVGDKSR